MKFNFINLKSKPDSNSGLTLLEVLLSTFITITIALGVGLILRGTYSLFDYEITQAKSVKTNQLLLNTVTTDFGSANIFYVSAAVATNGSSLTNPNTLCSTWDGVDYNSIRPLFTIGINTVDLNSSIAGITYVGYEIRLAPDNTSGELWRVPCDALGAQPNLEKQILVNDNLAVPASPLWTYTSNTWSVQCNQILDTTNTSTDSIFVQCPSDVAIPTTTQTSDNLASPSPTSSTSSSGTINVSRGIIFRTFSKTGIEMSRVLSSRSML